MTELASVERVTESDKIQDGLDLSAHRISQDFESMIGLKKIITTVPIRKPHKQEFVRVHPSPKMSESTVAFKLEDDNELYILAPELRSELIDQIFAVELLTTINRANVLTLWPIRLPGPDGKVNSWNQSAFEAAKLAKTDWVRLTSKMSLGAYEISKAMGNLPDPEWPELDFQEIFRIAFKDRIIQERDHPILKHMRGE